MPSQKKRPGKYGTAPVTAASEAPKNAHVRAYEKAHMEACARWLWEAERKRPHRLHAVPVALTEGVRLLEAKGYVELVARNDDICRLTTAFKPWWKAP